MDLDRRSLLAAAAAAAALPLLLPRELRAFAERSEREPEDLDQAVARARRRGKPLLAFVVPDADEAARWARGRVLGQWLWNAPDDVLADLVLADWWCGGAAALARRGHLGRGESAPWLVWIDLPAIHPAPRRLAYELAAPAEGETAAEGRARLAEAQATAAAAFGTFVRAAAAPDAATLRRRAAFARTRFGPAGLESLERLALAAEPFEFSRIETAAALLRERAARAGAACEAALAARIGAAVRGHWRDHAVPGSGWAKATPCGAEIVVGPALPVRGFCGMARVVEPSGRFLYFYVQAGSAR